MRVKSETEVAQSCPTLSDPIDCSPPGSSVHGIFQARGLDWGVIAFSRTNHRREETKRKKELNLLQGKNSTFLKAWEKETSNTIGQKKKKRVKRQRNTTQMKEQTRNTDVQINEEEVGKLPGKEFRIMIVKMIKNLENKIEKM